MLQPKETYSVKNISPHGIDFTYAPTQGRGVMYHTPLLGAFQIENLSLALRVTEFLSERDRWEMSPAKLKQTVETIQMPGRVQIINQNKVPFLIDTAHNEQKMDALLETLRKTYPHSRFLFVVAFKKGKDYKRMIEHIAEVAEKIIITRFLKENQDVVHKSVPAEDISYELNRRGYHAYEICESTQHALNKALKQTEYLPVITGSLYFVGDLYERYTSHI
jgi:dihydrofolate synthase/folylpolyglutamate synthase